jgi:hypothetical protein
MATDHSPSDKSTVFGRRTVKLEIVFEGMAALFTSGVLLGITI